MSAAAVRPYRQVARAAATEDLRLRVVAAFRDALLARWMDEITLDDIAATAGTTRQTVIRYFGGKDGLLTAVAETIKLEVETARTIGPGFSPRAIAHGLVRDYETSGDVIIRLLAQEERHPLLTPFLNLGRAWHRQWAAETFATSLIGLKRQQRERRITEFVAVTDVYVWKLLRRDFGNSATDVETLLAEMLGKLMQGEKQQ